MNRSILLLFFVFIIFSCGDDDLQEETTPECGGALSVMVDGEALIYGAPSGAVLSLNDFTQNHELNLVWISNKGTISIQLLVDIGTENCLNIGRINSDNLPSEVSIFTLQYFNISGAEAGVSNVFEDPNASGWVEIIECDGINDILSVDFEFNGVSADGNTEIIVKNGSAKDICFSRTK